MVGTGGRAGQEREKLPERAPGTQGDGLNMSLSREIHLLGTDGEDRGRERVSVSLWEGRRGSRGARKGDLWKINTL